MEKKKIIITKRPRDFMVHVENDPGIPPIYATTYLEALGFLLKWHDEELGITVRWNIEDELTNRYLEYVSSEGRNG